MKKLILMLGLVLLFVSSAKADEYTHALGTTSYMLREAMMAKANRHAPELYWEALEWQKKAKMAFRGQWPMKRGKRTVYVRSRAKAMEFTKKAYDLALQAKNKALQAQGKWF